MASTSGPDSRASSEPGDVPGLCCAIAQQTRDPVTLGHEHRTATLARELAQLHGVDPDRAELAALVHDIAAHHSTASQVSLARQFAIPMSNAETLRPALLHGPVGAELLRREYAVLDEELLDAVRTHVVGGPHLSPLAKILFIADKLEPGCDRLTHNLEAIRVEARIDLDRALLQLYASQITDLVARGLPIDERTVTARNGLIEQRSSRI